jgi:hypothetical protein
VEIVLSMGGNDVVGSEGNPYRVNLVAGEIFTVEDEALELEPGDYSLDHFSVHNSDGDLIWISPRSGSPLASFVDNALPIAIDLRAGVKKYVDVPVLCFDDRDVNEYGYLFFELDTNIALTYCFFANYCDDEGRHYPARYSVSIWSGTSSAGVALYEGVINETGVHDNGDSFATPLCFALPDNDDMDEDYLYYEVTLLDWDENDGGYGDIDPVMISGTLSKADIVANFNGDDVEYNHLRFCGDGDPVDPGNGNGNGGTDPDPSDCLPAPGDGCDSLSFTQTVSLEGFPAVVDEPFYALVIDGETVGSITFVLASAGASTMDVQIDLNEGYSLTDIEVSLPDFVDTEICVQNINENDFVITYDVDDAEGGIEFPVDVEFSANVCM